MENLTEYIQNNFLNVPLTKETMYIYAPRTNILNAIKTVIPLFQGEVADLGCGVMPYRELIQGNPRVNSYVGIDLEGSDYHQKIIPDLFWDGKHLPLESESIDCLLATEFMEHYAHTADILEEIKRVLKPGGLVFTTTPFIWNLHEIPYDEYRYTPYALKRIFKTVGFENIQINPTSGWNNSLATMLALWINCAPMSNKKRKWLFKIIFPIFKYLVKNDEIPTDFDNWHKSMSQGYAALCYKPL